MEPSDITLGLLISDWLKMRGLKWKYNPKSGELVMRITDADMIEPYVKVNDDNVIYDQTVCFDMIRLNLTAADPEFFQKLERVLRREEKWIHALENIKHIADAIHVTWQPMLGVVWDWLENAISACRRAWKRYKRL